MDENLIPPIPESSPAYQSKKLLFVIGIIISIITIISGYLVYVATVTDNPNTQYSETSLSEPTAENISISITPTDTARPHPEEEETNPPVQRISSLLFNNDPTGNAPYEIVYHPNCRIVKTDPVTNSSFDIDDRIIECDINGSTFTIYPQSNNHGVESILSDDQVTINNNQWNRKKWKDGTIIGITYNATVNGNFYSIASHFDSDSQEAIELFDTIMESFVAK